MQNKFKHYMGRLIDLVLIPIIPKKYRLMAQFYKNVTLLEWEPEVRYITKFARAGGLAVDIGGNLGLWTYAMVKSKMFEGVLVFEPNSAMTSDLKNAGFDNVTIAHKAVSSINGLSRLRIPIHCNVALNGWASLENQIDIDTNEFQELNVETIRLDELNLIDVSFIKIDVEGHELDLLKGAVDFFFRNRPVCIIECRDKNRRQVEDFFINLNAGYRLIDTKSIYNFSLSPGNIIFSTR